MTNTDSLIADVIATAGGRLVGRVRLQKTFYLLEQLGLGSELGFDYHHYGPYSADLAAAIADATAFNLIKEEYERRPDGVAYSVYSTEQGAPNRLGIFDAETGQTALQKMQICSSTVLELAATIHWLANREKNKDWRTELKRRKGIKTEAGRADTALRLLHDLGLDGGLA